ncbi:MAG: gfo/Idh/MocA family oxidoreductase [Firmicutes bacterium]|nr:gfo/Idh/MocA family oxidoreductase [Bacillota bacterium]
MKVAVIGAGTMGTVHSEAYADMPGTQIAGIVDIRLAAAQSLAARTQTNAYDSFDALLAHEQPDVIDICVPTYRHRAYTEQAAHAGKHVICEKPMARTLADARAMLNVCESADVRLFLAHVVRFFPEYSRATRSVQKGAVGKPGVIRTTRAGGHPTAWEDWYASYARSGGVIMDLLIHDFDWLRATFGEVERIFARSLRGRDTQRLDYALVTLRFATGAIAHVEGSWAHRGGFHTSIEIAGTVGMIEHDSRQSAPIRVHTESREQGQAGVAVPESPLAQSPYYLELENFMNCIRTNTQPIVTAEDGYKALEIAAAANLSAATGRPATPGEEEAL